MFSKLSSTPLQQSTHVRPFSDTKHSRTPGPQSIVDGLGARNSAPVRASSSASGIAAIRMVLSGCTSSPAGLARRVTSCAAGSRENHFFRSGDENNNIHTVVHTPKVPHTSAGFKDKKFCHELGDTRHAHFDDKTNGPETPSRELARLAAEHPDPHRQQQCIHALRRRAEQEYLMQGMPKDAMSAAAQIANRRGLGIVVRPTGLLAHMGIESGMPTKAQEFKNKTSKEIDLWLCDELRWGDVGKVVHYDPRVGWNSKDAAKETTSTPKSTSSLPKGPATTEQWHEKLEYIVKVRHTQLKEQLGSRIGKMPSISELEAAFFSRANEYMAEDDAYRHGELAQHTLLDGPRIRLKARPDEDMVGDLDLFAFTSERVEKADSAKRVTATRIEPDVEDPNVKKTQIALQSSHAFQAQHGPIWNWDPTRNTDPKVAKFNTGIKNVIMAAHSPDSNDPLIHIQPGGRVRAVFYDAVKQELRSVWDEPASTGWLAKTHSGALLKAPAPQRRL